jgi:phosphopantothenoylcysteine synthetase/decarboxylase
MTLATMGIAPPWVFTMNLLITAGNTQVQIDSVRSITNIFTGRTGAAIALHAHAEGHRVTLLTSQPDTVAELKAVRQRWRLERYRTFADLEQLLGAEVVGGNYDAVIHCAAVSDYLAAGIYAPAPATQFTQATATWSGSPPALVDRAAAKVKSDEPELWLRLVRAPKLIDHIRGTWGFRGVLVKFKLEVGVGMEQLLDLGERSRRHSDADLMVANTLEGVHAWAYLGPFEGAYQRIERSELPRRLLAAIAQKMQERTHG